MPWEYSQSAGKLKHNGLKIAIGYTGKDKGKTIQYGVCTLC